MSAVVERQRVPLSSMREVKPNSFIFERPGALPPSFCEEVMRRFEAQPEYHHAGRIGQTQAQDASIKKTTDVVVSNKADWKDLDQMFFHCVAAALQEFRQSYPYFKGPFKDMGYQVQRYLPGEYYHCCGI